MTGLLRLSPTFPLSCSILALVKLWLVRGDEVPCLGSPFDDIWYLQSARDWYWLRAYDALPFGTPPYIRLPAYPLYVALVNLTGIPLRIANELLLLFAAFVFAWVLLKAGQSQLLCVLFYAVIIFHPGTFFINNFAYPDTLYAPILLFCLAGLILLLVKREDAHRLWYALATGVALAILWHIRQESIIIMGFYGVYAVLWFLNARRHSGSPPRKIRSFMILVATPVLVILAVLVVVRTVNYNRFGVFSGDAMFTSDFEAACKALVRIKPQVPIRFVPVPREVRERAYLVSPSFSELKSYFEGDPGKTWASFGPSAGVEAPGEISAGHIWWGLNQATYYAGYNRSARQAGRFYRRMAAEINAACDDGRLECRPVISALIDPARQNYVPYLRHSLFRITRLFTTAEEPPRLQDMDKLPVEIRAMADSVTNRRAAFRSDVPAGLPGRRIALQSFIWSHHGKLTVLLTYAGLGALLLLLICHRRLDLKDPVFSIMILLVAVIAIRVAVVTFIDASWWPVNDIRYIFPVLYLYTCFLLMLIAYALRLVVLSIKGMQVLQRISWRNVFNKAPDEAGGVPR